MSDEIETEPGLQDRPPSNGGKIFSAVLLVVVAVAFAFAFTIRPVSKAPEIRADGWLNGPAPTPEELHGKVLVVDAWAFWCGPCRAAAPELVKLHERYRDRGVMFIGLTSERSDRDPENRHFLAETKITWPNGYGAVETLIKLKADSIPQVWVIDRKYNLIWNINSSEPIESAIERALAQKP